MRNFPGGCGQARLKREKSGGKETNKHAAARARVRAALETR